MARMNPWILHYESKDYANGDYSQCKLDCSLGVHPDPLPQEVISAMGTLTADTLKNYPHDDKFVNTLIQNFSHLAPMSSENIALGCGSADLFFAINKLFLSPGAVALGIAPQFSAYVDDVHFCGATYRPFILSPENNYHLDAEKLTAYIENFPEPIQVIYVDNPNNPTGQVLNADEVERLIRAAQKRDAAIIIDEAYGDFMPTELSAVRFIHKYDNLYVLKSMSKGYGMAGMRLGYVFSSPLAIRQIKKLVPPYNANALARELGNVMLKKAPEYQAALSNITANKSVQMYKLLEGGPIHVAQTVPYTPISLLYTDDVSVDLCEVFRQVSLAVVSGASFEKLGINTVRMMVPQETDMPLFLELLDEAQKILSK